MPKATNPRRSTRKREPPHKFEPVEAPSPSRPAKRRRGNAQNRQYNDDADEAHDDENELEPDVELSQAQGQATAEQSSDGEEEDDEEKAERQRRSEQIEAFIPRLREGPEPVNAQQQHPNVDRFVRAVAKISGRKWTFYPRSSRITIGRQGERKNERPEDDEDSVDEPPPDIDLGPGKHVSREHAEIKYQDDERWYLSVIGRNGAKVNNNLVKKGQNAVIESGDVIEIAGTEMIFVSAVSPALIQDIYLERLKHPPEEAIKQEGVQSKTSPWPAHRHAHPTPSSTSPYQGSSHFISPYGPPVLADAASSGNSDRPSTPTSTVVQQHPYLAQTINQSKSKPVMLENSEQIDYANDANKDVKPPMSYATLIAQAILAGPNERSSLSGIYEWIKRNFAYYRHIDPGWQNSIRHNLSLNQAFDKVARESHEPGKGGMWFIVPEKKDDFKRMGWKMTSRGGARPSSNPSSPAPPKNKSPKRRTPPRPARSGIEEQTPAPAAIRQPSQPSQTPLRQTTNVTVIPRIDPHPQLIDDNSPLPMRQSFLGNTGNTTGSPTMLSSSLLDETAAGHSSFANPFTPAPRRQEPSFNVPSTAKLPSQYLLQSSPAPFWKDFETPSALPQTSPVKVDPNAKNVPPASSSPPREGQNGSPIRIRAKAEAGLGLKGVSEQEGNVQVVEKVEEGEVDLMGHFPKIGDPRTVNPAY